METTLKVSDSEIEITNKVTETQTSTVTYERGFIENQILAIQKDKETYNALRDAEILECKNILAKMDLLGIIETI